MFYPFMQSVTDIVILYTTVLIRVVICYKIFFFVYVFFFYPTFHVELMSYPVGKNENVVSIFHLQINIKASFKKNISLSFFFPCVRLFCWKKAFFEKRNRELW